MIMNIPPNHFPKPCLFCSNLALAAFSMSSMDKSPLENFSSKTSSETLEAPLLAGPVLVAWAVWRSSALVLKRL